MKFINPPTYDFYKRRIGELCEQFPTVFNKAFPLPLPVGIHKRLPELTGFSQKEINALLRVWVGRQEYILMAVSVGNRYELDGTVQSRISRDEMNGFIHIASRLMYNRPGAVRRFATFYNKRFGRPPMIFVPIANRPNPESSDGSDTSQHHSGSE